jgi:hypothetical protein
MRLGHVTYARKDAIGDATTKIASNAAGALSPVRKAQRLRSPEPYSERRWPVASLNAVMHIYFVQGETIVGFSGYHHRQCIED